MRISCQPTIESAACVRPVRVRGGKHSSGVLAELLIKHVGPDPARFSSGR
jgi:hypothetical protein